MQVKSEVISRFGNSVDFSSGEPLGGVEASTVGADLCVRPSSPERSLLCGRTRRSAPTQATSARQFHSSNAVTPPCRDARSERPLYHRLHHCDLTGTDAQIVRPYKGLHVTASISVFTRRVPQRVLSMALTSRGLYILYMCRYVASLLSRL